MTIYVTEIHNVASLSVLSPHLKKQRFFHDSRVRMTRKLPICSSDTIFISNLALLKGSVQKFFSSPITSINYFSLSKVNQRGLNVPFMIQKLDQWISMNGNYCAVPFISQCNTPPADQGKSSNLNFQVIT